MFPGQYCTIDPILSFKGTKELKILRNKYLKLIIFQQAALTLSKLRGIDINDKTIQKEIDYMKNEENVYKSLPKITYLKICK